MLNKVLIKVLVFIVLYCVWVMVALAIMLSIFVNSDTDKLNPLGLIFYIVLIMPPIWLFGKWMNAAPRWAKKVRTEGIQAPATIVSVNNTGVVINNTIAVVKLHLRVEPPGEEPFEVSQEKEISMLSGLGAYGYHAGAKLHVKYDPNNKKHVVLLDGSHASSSPVVTSPSSSSQGATSHSKHAHLSQHESGMSSAEFAQELSNRSNHNANHSGVVVADELARLSELHKSGELSNSEFEAAKRKLLG